MRFTSFFRGACVALLIPFTVNCAGEGTASPGLEASVDTIGGIEHYHYPESGATTLPWRFDTIAVIGGFDVDDPDKQFGQVASNGLASDDAGNLFVFDNQGRRIIRFSRAGDATGTWGREGEGPGEIGTGGGVLSMGPGDTLWLADGSNQRITLFPVAGGDPASIPVTEETKGFRGNLRTVDGGVLSLLNPFGVSPGKQVTIPSRPLVHIARDGRITDTLWMVPPAEMDLATVAVGDKDMVLSVPRRFSPGFSYDRFSDGGLVLHDQASYDLRLLDADGGVQRVIQRDPPPRPTTDEDRRRAIDEMLEQADDPKGGVIEQMAGAMTFYDSIPRINTLRLDQEDRIWVGVSVASPETNDRIDVYSRDGQLLGELHGADLPDLFLGDGYAALITEDALDVQQIVILSVVEKN